ncbi:MAG: leucine-rich repeat protein, partial [Bacteroidales bacterium]
KIPSRTTKIDRYAFSNNNSLASVFIPLSVTTIGSNAFTGIKSAAGTIVTEHSSRPAGWDIDWNGNINNVKWAVE